jgi:hypothetical protein
MLGPKNWEIRKNVRTVKELNKPNIYCSQPVVTCPSDNLALVFILFFQINVNLDLKNDFKILKIINVEEFFFQYRLRCTGIGHISNHFRAHISNPSTNYYKNSYSWVVI